MDKELEELHVQLLDITRDLVETCKENNIDYFLAWGSCLGAVRHHDIIPWDDDVDMYIPFKDYNKLRKIYIKRNSDYFYQDIGTDPVYFMPFSKIRKTSTTSMSIGYKKMKMHWGICVDLFPLFEYDKPVADRATKRKIYLLQKLAYLSLCKEMKSTPVQKAGAILYSLIGKKNRQKLFFKILNSIERKGDYLLDLEGNDHQPVIMKKEIFYPAGNGTFRGMDISIPGNYDHYLRSVYGDNYMEIPKEGSKFRYAHDGIIVDCHKSFKEYQ